MKRRHLSSIGGPRLPRRERGVILFVALILLVILSLLGVTAARLQTSEERMARNEDNRQIGAQAAEAALRNAEANIAGGAFTALTANTAGQYTLNWNNGPWASLITNWNDPTQTLSYSAPATAGVTAGPPLAALPPGVPSPTYIVEQLPAVTIPGDNLACTGYGCPTGTVSVYRVTATGTGADQSTTTTLQSIYR
jgi:type IV pilus assembly protein PilX